MHLKFVNAIASYAQALNLPKEHEHSAFQFHRDMFQSGIERILSVRSPLLRPVHNVLTPSLSFGADCTQSVDDILSDATS